MIPNHPQFLEALQEQKKVSVRFYSQADSGVVDRVCAPLDYGPGVGTQDGVNRYSFWDYAATTESHTLDLTPLQILDLRVLGERFDPAQLDFKPSQWAVAREWGMPGEPVTALGGTTTPHPT